MYTYKYPHPAVTTDCVIFGWDGTQLQVLLIQRGNDPFKGKWAFPGGFLNPNESCEEGAARELEEETGFTGAHIEQFHTFSTPNRDPRERIITVAFYALVRIRDVQGADDAAQAMWFSLNSIPPLAFDHEEMFRLAKNCLWERLHFETAESKLITQNFTEKELETILNSLK